MKDKQQADVPTVSGRPADPVNIGVDVLRQIVVDDVRDLLQVTAIGPALRAIQEEK